MSRTKVKLFDRINMAADIAFLAHCSCKGDVCNCSHDGQDLFHTLSASKNKGTDMSITKFADLIKNATSHDRIKLLDDIKAAAPSLPLHDLKALTAALTEVVNAESAKTDRKSQRLARIAAAQADPQMEPTINYCSGRLHSLGLDINSLAASADVHALDKAMAEQKWNSEQRIGMKSALSRIGVLD
jgi:hypothetical protein